MPELTKVTFYLSDEDRRSLARIQERHPNWSVAVIFKRALGLYASNLKRFEPASVTNKSPCQQTTEELFGPP